MGLGDKVFDSQVTVNDVGIKITVDGTGLPIEIDSVDPSKNVPMPTALYEYDGTNYVPISRAPLFVSVIDTAATNIDVVGVIVGAIATAGQVLEVASNANDIMIEVNGVDVMGVLAGSRISSKVELQVGNVVVKSMAGATIDSGSIAITILG